MMRKGLSLVLALVLALALCSAAFADDPDEIPGTVEMPYAGLRFTPPELYRNTTGRVVTDGAIELYSGIYYAYWLYGAMTGDELAALYENPSAAASSPLIELFYVFSINNGMSFDDMNALIGGALSAEYAREIGKVGDCSFFLYMEDTNQAFADSIDAVYRDEYIALSGAADDIASAFTCYEPVAKPDPYAGLVGSKAEFITTDIDGNAVSSADLFAQNEITMVNIWATWCGPCINELAELQQIHLRLQEKNCGVVGLLDDTDLDSARRLMTENGVAYPVILAPDNLNSVFPLQAYPSTFFVGRDGTILAAPVIGAYVGQYENELDALLQK